MVNMHPPVSAAAHFRGTHSLVHVLKIGQRKDNETFRQYLCIIFQSNIPKNNFFVRSAGIL